MADERRADEYTALPTVEPPPNFEPVQSFGGLPDTPHEHVWQPNGIVEEQCILGSPVSTWDDYLYTAMYSISVCTCGKVHKVKVGEKDGRSRGDDLRAGRG